MKCFVNVFVGAILAYLIGTSIGVFATLDMKYYLPHNIEEEGRYVLAIFCLIGGLLGYLQYLEKYHPTYW